MNKYFDNIKRSREKLKRDINWQRRRTGLFVGKKSKILRIVRSVTFCLGSNIALWFRYRVKCFEYSNSIHFGNSAMLCYQHGQIPWD